MDWTTIYEKKKMTATEAVFSHVKNNDNIFLGGTVTAVHTLKEVFCLVKNGKLKGLRLHGNAVRDELPLNDTDFTEDKLRYYSFFHGALEREATTYGSVAFVPMQFSQHWRYMQHVSPDVAIVPMTPPDDKGYCGLGCFSSGYSPAGVMNSKKIIAQINPQLPRVCGLNQDYHVNDIAAFVEYEEDIPLYNTLIPSEIDKQIVSHIIDLIPDGACIQLGLGGMANAVGFGLREKKHLGVHSEMLTESMVELYKLGIIDNSRKSLHKGVSVCGFTLGKLDQYQFVTNNPDFMFVPYEYSNDINNISANDNMISINTAISVDLSGQVNAESVGFRQFSGTGGQVDFIRGATLSKGGKSFITLASVANTKSGPISKITLDFEPGSITTSLRSEVQYIATEYGCVDLKWCDIPTRAKKLIGIAHPDFRDELTFQAKKAGYLY